jgi:branched-chain amino acid transport system ATP-binding protein
LLSSAAGQTATGLAGDSAAPAALDLEGVTVAFSGLTAVDSVTLSFRRGERCAVIGPNGAGKTTLFRAISGETALTSGRIRLLGRDITTAAPERRAAIGLGRTFQVSSLFGGLTVEENVLLAVLSRRPERRCFWRVLRIDRELDGLIDALLGRVLLTRRRHDLVGVLSHGEQRQLELGVAIASNPTVLLLDEPAAGLSGTEREMLGELIRSLDGSMTLLIIDHDIDLVLGLTDRVVCMDNGVVIADGAPQDVRADERVRNVYLGVV